MMEERTMAGIRVSNIPKQVTEKNLKVYFGNPQNGGGHLRRIIYPLLNNSAAVYFNDPQDAENVLGRNHRLKNQDVHVTRLPKKVFGNVTVVLEDQVTAFINHNKSIADDLQFDGELTVDFSYDQEKYIVSGSWDQMEWALNYLDSVYKPEGASRTTDVTETGQQQQQQQQQKQQQQQQQQQQGATGYTQYNMSTQITGQGTPSFGREKFKTDKKPLNIQPESEVLFPRPAEIPVHYSSMPSIDNKRGFGDTYRSNLNEQQRSVPGPNIQQQGQAIRGRASSDSDNEGSSDQQGQSGDDRKVTFSNDTDFREMKGRPRHVAPKRTAGIDVSAFAGIGDTNLTFTFTVGTSSKVTVTMDDITEETANAIVNPTQTDLHNISGVSRAIAQKCGEQMNKECRDHISINGHLKVTEVVHTCAGGRMNHKVSFVLHVAGPFWSDSEAEESTHQLVCSYINCLLYASKQLWLVSLATPLISAGMFGFPLDVCVQAFYDALLLFSLSDENGNHLRELRLICLDPDTTGVVIMLLQSLLEVQLDQAQSAAYDRYQSGAAKINLRANNFDLPALRKEISFLGKGSTEVSQAKEEESPSGSEGEDDNKAEETADLQQGNTLSRTGPQAVLLGNNDDSDDEDEEEEDDDDEDDEITHKEEEEEETETRGSASYQTPMYIALSNSNTDEDTSDEENRERKVDEGERNVEAEEEVTTITVGPYSEVLNLDLSDTRRVVVVEEKDDTGSLPDVDNREEKDDTDSLPDVDNREEKDDTDSLPDVDNREEKDDTDSLPDVDNREEKDDTGSLPDVDNREEKDDTDSVPDVDNREEKDDTGSLPDVDNREEKDDTGSLPDVDNREEKDDTDSLPDVDNREEKDDTGSLPDVDNREEKDARGGKCQAGDTEEKDDTDSLADVDNRKEKDAGCGKCQADDTEEKDDRVIEAAHGDRKEKDKVEKEVEEQTEEISDDEKLGFEMVSAGSYVGTKEILEKSVSTHRDITEHVVDSQENMADETGALASPANANNNKNDVNLGPSEGVMDKDLPQFYSTEDQSMVTVTLEKQEDGQTTKKSPSEEGDEDNETNN